MIPVFNAEQYLARCVDSILAQTYQPYEIVLVDDGSEDTSATICDAYAEKHSNICVIHKTNEGLGYARNTGLKSVRGECVVFIDSDDYVKPMLIQKLVEAKNKSSADTVISGYTRISPKGVILSKKAYATETVEGPDVLNNLVPRMMGSAPDKSDSIDMGATHVLYSMDIIRFNKLEFPSERVMISEDVIFNLAYYQFAKTVYLIDACDYCYFANQGSLTMKYKDNRFEQTKALYFAEIEILKRMGIYEISKIRLVRTFFYNLKMCIIQENSGLSQNNFKRQMSRIGLICNDIDVLSAIEQYPVNKLGIPQRMFLEIIRMKLKLAIWIMIEMKVIG